MSPGKLIENPDARPFRPPRREEERVPELAGSGTGPGSEERRRREELIARAREEAARELRAEREKLQRRFSEAVARLEALARDISEELQKEVPRLALEIAGRIVRARIEGGDEIAARVVAEVLARPLAGGVRRVRLHPDDLAAAGEGLPAGPAGAPVKLVADPTVGRGGAIVETEEEEIDARLETGFRAFWDALMEDR